jgi:eukaryotic-like serine/threonine-protein kinase
MNEPGLHCPNGHALPLGNAASRFCTICGASMVITCSQGHEVRPAPYCSACGVHLPPTGLSAAGAEHAQKAQPENGLPATTPPTRRPNRRLLFIAATVLVTLLIGGGAYFGITQWTGSDSGRPMSTVPASVSPSLTTSETLPPQPTDQPPSVSPTPSRPTAQSSPAEGSPEGTVDAYFDAINAGAYKRAWELGGKNLQRGSYSSFVRGFADTAYDSVTIVSVVGDTVEIELDARQTDGTHRYFAGTYTVRDGVIVAADIHSQ